MDPIKLNHDSSHGERHACESYREGDWIIYVCEKCPGYERRLNWRTGETNVRRPEEGADILHSGSHFPIEYVNAFTNVN